MYVSQNYICFESKIFGIKTMVPFFYLEQSYVNTLTGDHSIQRYNCAIKEVEKTQFCSWYRDFNPFTNSIVPQLILHHLRVLIIFLFSFFFGFSITLLRSCPEFEHLSFLLKCGGNMCPKTKITQTKMILVYANLHYY